MTRLIIVVLFLSSLSIAKDRNWQEATFVSVSSQISDGGTVIAPVGTMLAGIPIRVNRTYYRIETSDRIYTLVTVNKKPLNLTLHGPTKISIDGENAWILDDSGKSIKLPIAQKAMKQ